jgi:hypothetical protein
MGAMGKQKEQEPVRPVLLTWTTERRAIKDLTEWPKNPRTLSDSQAKQLEQSLRKFGFVEPLAINLDNRIIGGHMRRRILMAQSLVSPDGTVEVRVPSRLLTEDECEELGIRLNKNTGEFDFDTLANEFELDKLLSWGFESWEFGGAGEEEPLPPEGGSGGTPGQVKCPNCGHCFVP